MGDGGERTNLGGRIFSHLAQRRLKFLNIFDKLGNLQKATKITLTNFNQFVSTPPEPEVFGNKTHLFLFCGELDFEAGATQIVDRLLHVGPTSVRLEVRSSRDFVAN